jgi:glycosyltransferase involved in cell wall biosynthesis
MPKIGIVYSSFNNYGLLEECLNTINFEGYPIINIDDYSSEEEATFGKKLCKNHNIPFIKNTKKGVQFAVDNGIKILKDRYLNTLVDKLYIHDCRKGPIKVYKKLELSAHD